ncbi:hypothetical protein N0V82_000227 [Gnomoniopsis sp. IMI 355080]|nr:hypothetical protein N0V82_000227 [Gnomoniopsis sp. IMI 355080]
MPKTATINMAKQPEDDWADRTRGASIDRTPSPDEATTLLGGGASDSDPGDDPTLRRDSWVGDKEYAHLPWYRKPHVFWLIPPYALYTLAFGGSIVPKLNLIIDLVCQQYFAEKTIRDGRNGAIPITWGGDNPQCNIPEVQADVATFMLILSLIGGVLSAYTAPKIGSLSDRYGRKKLLALASFGGVLGEIVTIFAAKFPDVVHYRWLLLGVTFDGLAGSFTAGSVLSQSYTADCTPPSKRGVAIGYMHACLFSGLAFGPFIAAYFVKWTGSLLSIFYISVSCHVLFMIVVGFVIPESVSKRRQRLAREKRRMDNEKRNRKTREWASAYIDAARGSNNWLWSWLATPKHANLLASIRSANPFEPLKTLAPKGAENKRVRRNLILLAVMDMVILGAAMSSGQVTLLYTEYIFNWGNFETSQYISLISLVRVIILIGVFPVINYIFRIRPAQRRRRESGSIVESNSGADELDVWILRFAIVSDVVGVAGYIFARTPALFVVSGCITAFGGLGSATIQSMLSKHVSAERTGALLGAIGLLHALSRIIAPVIFNGLYAATVKTFPQAVFVALTVMFCLMLVLSTMVKPHVFLTDPVEPEAESPTRPGVPRQNTLTEDEVLPI